MVNNWQLPSGHCANGDSIITYLTRVHPITITTLNQHNEVSSTGRQKKWKQQNLGGSRFYTNTVWWKELRYYEF